jgi:ParB/RepB/Spo0J family partition protein
MITTPSATSFDPAFRVVSSVQDIPVDRIRESNSNPRRNFDERKLRELAANIKLHGVLQAILVRPTPDGADGIYELVAGARRFRASKLAGKQTIPATVRDLTDAECREIQLVQNLQRADIHELDEGIGYRSLMELKPDFYTVETIAVQVARSPAYVKGRISLTDLIPAAQTAFYEDKLTVAHALELARLQPADQDHALIDCFPGHRSTASILKDRKAEAMTVRQLRDWIEREIHLDLKNAPFDVNDANLLPAAGPCSICPKRTGNNPLLFPEVRNKSVCTDPACYRTKIQALVQARLEPLVKEGQKPVQISSAPYWQVRSKSSNTLYEGQYRRAEREGECPHTQAAVIVDGRQAGTILHVQMRNAKHTGSSLITKSRHKSVHSGENWRLQFEFRRNRVRGFCRPFGKSFLANWRARISRWSHSTISGAWGTTTIIGCSRSTAGKRKRRRHPGAELQ